ncbi:MAG TPA: hypothetical protein VL026_00570 [Rhizomicrobium sp.]|nr:hypothetical protein [Rhizomicrobium sp.]
MSLSIDQPIRYSDLLEIRHLKDGKIFLLKGKDGSNLVLKAEANVTGDRIKAAAPVLKAIDPTVRMKPIDPSEIIEIEKFLKAWRKYVDFIEWAAGSGSNTPIANAEEFCMSELASCIRQFGAVGPGGKTSIAKMSYVRMSTLGIVLDVERAALTDASWTEAREMFAKFIKALNKSGGLEKLGQIMAGDFFISNQDRFQSNGQGMGTMIHVQEPTDGKRKRSHVLKVLFNLNNIILVKPAKGKKTRPSMLDYMDPNAMFSDIGQTVDALEAASVVKQDPKTWPMRVLIDRKERSTIAKNLADDLAYILQPQPGNSFFGRGNVGGSGAAARIEKGILQGIRAIAKALRAKQGRLSIHVQSCYEQIKGV